MYTHIHIKICMEWEDPNERPSNENGLTPRHATVEIQPELYLSPCLWNFQTPRHCLLQAVQDGFTLQLEIDGERELAREVFTTSKFTINQTSF